MNMESQFDAIPFRGRWLDSNYKAYCRSCDQEFRLWYGSSSPDRQKKMEGDYLGTTLDCAACKVTKGNSDSAKVFRKLTVDESVKALYMLSQNTGIDYAEAERQASYQTRMDRETEEMEAKTDWYLQKKSV